MKLYDLVPNQETILSEAFKHPVMKIKPRAANPYPSLDDALRATVNAIENAVIQTVAEEVQPQMDDVLLNYTLMNGDFEDSEAQDEWESGLDDQVEEAIEKWVPILSQDWLGNHTIGSGLHLDDGPKKFAYSLGREVYKQMTYALDKSPAQIMSAAGIVQKDVEARLALHNKPTKETETMSESTEDIDGVIAKIAEYVGKDYDILTVYEDLDLASDDDEVLGAGAAARLGIEEADLEVLRDARLIEGDEIVDKLSEMLAEAVKSGGKKKAPAKKAPAAEKPAKAAKPAKAPAPAKTGSGLEAATLQKLKNACTFKDADVAQRLGVSRATFNNWVNGKTVAELTGEQASELRDEIVGRANMLLESLAELDGTEAQVIF